MNAPNLPDFFDLFAIVFSDRKSPERRALAGTGLAPRDVMGIYYEAHEHMLKAWKPGRANFRTAVGAHFCRELKRQEGSQSREFATDPAALAQMHFETPSGEIERWRGEVSEEIEKMVAALTASVAKPGADRTARRHRAQLLARVQQGDLFAGAGGAA